MSAIMSLLAEKVHMKIFDNFCLYDTTKPASSQWSPQVHIQQDVELREQHQCPPGAQ